MSQRRVRRLRHRLRIYEGDALISDLPAQPGPTHTPFDVLAAAATVIAARSVLLLGFAGGGLIAPLRAVGCRAPLQGVDVDTALEPLFRELSREWAGEVALATDDAARWLESSARRFDLVIEDLSVPAGRSITKPPISLDPLPSLIAAHLAPGGLAAFNLLPVAGSTQREVVEAVTAPFARAVEISCSTWDNRLVLAGAPAADPRRLGRVLRGTLRSLGSRMVDEIHLRQAARPGGRVVADGVVDGPQTVAD